MGEIIYKINAGGIKGLTLMGFLAEKENRRYDLGAVQSAFACYYECVLSMTTQDERAQWGWSVVTAENHLCKHSRLYEWVSRME